MNRSPLLPIFLIVLVDVLGLTIILPLLPFYAEHLGASATVVGLLISSYAFCQLIAGPILGRWSDHIGRKPLLIVSQLGTLIGFLILAFAGSLWMVFLSRIIDGLTAGNLSLAQAYIADVTTHREPRQIVWRDLALLSASASSSGREYRVTSRSLAMFIRSSRRHFFPLRALSARQRCCRKRPPMRDDRDVGPGGRRLGILDWKAYAQYFARPKLGRLLWQFFFFAFSFCPVHLRIRALCAAAIHVPWAAIRGEGGWLRLRVASDSSGSSCRAGSSAGW